MNHILVEKTIHSRTLQCDRTEVVIQRKNDEKMIKNAIVLEGGGVDNRSTQIN